MNKTVKRTLLSVGGALGGALLTMLLRRDDDEQPAASSGAAAKAAGTPARSTGLRGQIVDLVSEILAETYRKVRQEPKERK